MLSRPHAIIVSDLRLDALIAKTFVTPPRFRTGSPWGTFADFLINTETRTLVGLTFEANGPDIQSAVSCASRDNDALSCVSSQNASHAKYPVINVESTFLEVRWSKLIPDQYRAAQNDYAVFGYQQNASLPSWIGLDSIELYRRQYDVRLPSETEWISTPRYVTS